jgi:hypothetical protein
MASFIHIGGKEMVFFLKKMQQVLPGNLLGGTLVKFCQEKKF